MALEYVTAAKIYNEWGEIEDLFVPGTSACLGCNSELLMFHTLCRVGLDCVVATPSGCIAGVGDVGVNGRITTKTPVLQPLLINTAAMLAGAKRYSNRIGRDVTKLALAGDGATPVRPSLQGLGLPRMKFPQNLGEKFIGGFQSADGSIGQKARPGIAATVK